MNVYISYDQHKNIALHNVVGSIYEYELTAVNVAGRKTMVKMASAFILSTSCLAMLDVSYAP